MRVSAKILKYKNLFSIALIIIVTFFIFSPSLKNGFIQWDDYLYIVSNPAIKSFSFENVKSIFTSVYISNYLPLTMLSYSLDYHFYKLSPFGYHLTNLILHLLNCVLVFWLFFIISKSAGVSFITTILFAIHPLRVESVAWIGERKDVLYAFFFLGAIVSYCRYLKERRVSRYYYIAIFLFLLSLMSKAMAVTLPLVLMLIDYFLGRRHDKFILIDKVPFFILSFIFGAAAIFAMGLNKYVWQKMSFDLFDKFAVAGYSIVFYLNKLFMPIGLSCLYVCRERVSLFYLLIIPLLIILFFACKRSKIIIFGAAFFLITILSVLKFVPFAGITAVADRYTYIPSIGLFFIVGEGFIRLYKINTKYISFVRALLIVALVTIITSLSSLTYDRCKIWKDELSLWDDALQKHQYHPLTYNNRGAAYLETGEFDKAISDLTKALEMDPCSILTLNNRGCAYGRQGEFGHAISDFNKSAGLDPKNTETYYKRGIIYMLNNQPEQALTDFNRVLEIDPDYTAALLKRAAVYFYKKEYKKSWDDLCRIERLGAAELIDPAFREDVKEGSTS